MSSSLSSPKASPSPAGLELGKAFPLLIRNWSWLWRFSSDYQLLFAIRTCMNAPSLCNRFSCPSSNKSRERQEPRAESDNLLFGNFSIIEVRWPSTKSSNYTTFHSRKKLSRTRKQEIFRLLFLPQFTPTAHQSAKDLSVSSYLTILDEICPRSVDV